RAAAARVSRPHGTRIHPHQARRERLEHLAHGDVARDRAHQPAQEDAGARPVARQSGPGTGARLRGAVNRGLFAMAGTLGLTAVMLGAFGAHGLRDRLGAAMIEVYRTGVLYHLVHALAVLA